MDVLLKNSFIIKSVISKGADNERKIIMFKRATAACIVLASMMSLTACGSESGKSEEQGVTKITVWAWEPSLPPVVKLFEKRHPDIKVKLINAGGGEKQYTALNNAIKAGSGAPDVAQIEAHAISEYVYQKQLVDISDQGAKKYNHFYQEGIWNSVNVNGGIYALPLGSGPMAFFYNKEVFDSVGVNSIPTTWEEFYEAAKKFRATGRYITSDVFDPGTFESFIWQAGGHPFVVKGNHIDIKLSSDQGTKKVVDYWQKMVDEDLINMSVKMWSEDWNHGLNDGSIASLVIGAWIPTTLVNSAPSTAGKWRVAQSPQWKAGEHANCENGGSTLAIMAGTSGEKLKAAYTFIDYASHDKEAIQARIDQGAFPDNLRSLKDESFSSSKEVVNSAGEHINFFGDQEYNKELLVAAENVTKQYQFLPYEVYSRSIFNDYVSGSLLKSGKSLKGGVDAWQQALIKYGKDNGFEISK